MPGPDKITIFWWIPAGTLHKSVVEKKNSWAISRISGKALPWKTSEQIITSVTCRLLRIKIRFLKDRYFHIYVKHAFNKVTSSTAPHWKLPVFKKLWDDSFACNCLQVLLNVSSWNES